ncbi:hypothetical protein [Demequina aurantiaca]|uniref:hypothetical protein n=1 Tax=Demequina aurantiaca TaxID=676200 RepID=UPI003D346B7D
MNRRQDAEFSIVAREVMSVAGAALESLDALIRENPDAEISRDKIISTIANSIPWPLGSTTENPQEEGPRNR